MKLALKSATTSTVTIINEVSVFMSAEQNKIIKTKLRRVEVSASPGSGKTRTLIERLQHLLVTVPAENILVLSFSNESVNVLKKRMGVRGNSKLSKVMVSTAHKFARGLINNKSVLLDKEASKLLAQAIKSIPKRCKTGAVWAGVSKSTKQRRLALLEQLLTQKHLMKQVLGLLSVARASRKKVADCLTGQFETLSSYKKVLPAIRNSYSDIKKKNSRIDFGDMLLGAVKAIHDGAPVPFTHILVDEYQDCSPAQTYLLAKLAELDGRHLIVFGDSYQGIYGFAGTKYTPLYSVLDDVQQLSMPVSWRLTSQTAAFASAIARLDEEHAIRTLRDGDMPVLLIDESEHKQAKRIVSDIRRLMDTGTPREQIAVLARTKALLHTVEQSLLASDIQTGRIGLMRHRKHPLRVLRLVRIVERCEAASKKVAPEMLSKVLSVINGVDDEQLKKQTLALDKVRRTPSLEGRYIHCAKIYLRLMGGVRSDKELRADVNRWEPFCRNHKDAKALRTAIMAIPSDKVVTATIHAAKGREWQHVFIVGVTDGLLPLYLAKDKQAISQERNTLYVAVTRAIDSVRLYHAPSVHSRSRQKFEKLSQFLRKSSVKETLKIGNGE